MKGDFTRLTFRPEKHYSRVLMQQGRVQMDADWNEEVDILNSLDETTRLDVIGAMGVPKLHDGFAISTNAGGTDLTISDGRIYVGGILAENDSTIDFATQPDLPDEQPITETGTFLIYIDVWQRHITALEDQTIREIALGGADTATRTKTVWQVRWLKLSDENASLTCDALPDWQSNAYPAKGKLEAQAQPQPNTSTNCIIEPSGGYRRLENQLYRVEVLQGTDSGSPTFIWSRDNGSVVTAWKSKNGDDLTVSGLGRDKTLGFAPGQWIELTDDTHELRHEPGTIVRVLKGEGQVITINPATATGSVDIADFPRNAKVRRWDMPPTGTGEIPITGNTWIDLEDGVQVKFDMSGAYNTGDYWLIPARTGANIEWPFTIPQAPQGIDHHLAALAVVKKYPNKPLTASDIEDCRQLFPSLTTLSAEDVSYNDGLCKMGAQTVQDALDKLCRERDLRFHKRHLHGWGIVCGLEVVCGSEAEGQPRLQVTVKSGYAIDPEGNDIEQDQDVPVNLVQEALNQKLIEPGKPGEVCITLNTDKTYGFEKYDPKKDNDIRELLAGTLLMDFYNDCIKSIQDFLKEELTPPDNEKDLPAGPVQQRVAALTNLLAQWFNPQPGQNIFISRREDTILHNFYDGLRKILQSETFCAMFDNARPFPDYPFNQLGMDTIFAKSNHTRLRLRPGGKEAYTVGAGLNPLKPSTLIYRFDLERRLLISQVDPVTQAEGNQATGDSGAGAVEDVAFSPEGDKIYVIIPTQNMQNTLFRTGTIKEDTIEWGPLFTICGVHLVTLATTAAYPEFVYAIGRDENEGGVGKGLGLYCIEPDIVDANLKPLVEFDAMGHLRITADGRAFTTMIPDRAQPSIAILNLLLQGELPPGSDTPIEINTTECDDIAIFMREDGATTETIYSAVGGGAKPKQLLAHDLTGALITQIPIENSTIRLESYAPTHMLLYTVEDDYCMKMIDMESNLLVEDYLLPMQVGPIAVAADTQTEFGYVLNQISDTISVVPGQLLDPTFQFPLDQLADYRLKVQEAFTDLLAGFLQYLKDCLCDHLLIKCPQHDPEDKIYLACVTIRDDQVYKVCNFSKRRYVKSFPTVEYWLSLFPILPLIDRAIQELCCATLPDLFSQFSVPVFRQFQMAARQQRVPVSGMRKGLSFFQSENIRSGVSEMRKKAGVLTNLFTERFTQADVSPSPAPKPALKIVDQPADTTETRLKERGVAVNRVRYQPGQVVKPISFFRAPQPGNEVTLYEENGVVRYYTVADAPSPQVSAVQDKVIALQTQIEVHQALLTDTQRLLKEREEKIADLDKQLADFKTSLQTTLVREARRPKITPHEWTVHGQVLDAAGNPIAGAQVRAFDQARKLDVLLGEVETNEYGDYALVYHERDFAGLHEDLPELYVMVSDETGNVLYSSPTSVRFKPGRVDQLDVQLGEEPPSTPAPKRSTRKSRKSRSS